MQFNCIGYHGTNADFVESIVKKGYFISDELSWFGKGVYFFVDYGNMTSGKKEAKSWVIRAKKFKKWAIFKAEIQSDKFIDLVENSEDQEEYEKIRKELLDLHLRSGKNIADFKDRMVFIHWEQQGFDVIRSVVDINKKSYFSYIVSRPQLQLCVKKLENIVKNDLVEIGEENVK